MAYKLRQGQQAFCLYTRLWGEARFKEILSQMRQKFIRQLIDRNRAMKISAVLMLFDWNKNRIVDNYLKSHYSDLDYIDYLTNVTMTCKICRKRLVVDVPCENIIYCKCPDSKPVYNKKFPNVPWIPFIERPDLLIWRKEKEQNSGLYEYILFGIYREVRADLFLKVQIDIEYRRKWDPTAVEIRIVDTDPQTGSNIIYWEMQWPKFFANRDYVYNRRYKIDPVENIIVITNQNVKHPNVPENPNKYRVKDYLCTMVIKPFTKFNEPGLKFCMSYFDNPGLSIPRPFQTWVATSALPNFLSQLREAAKNEVLVKDEVSEVLLEIEEPEPDR